jgi:hypothetical protein
VRQLRIASIASIVLIGVALALLAHGHERISIALIAAVCLIHTRSFDMLRMVTATLFNRSGSKG